jgi:hypothetical protein
MSVLVLHTTESDPGTAQTIATYLVSKGCQSHTVYDPSTGEHIRLLPWSQPAKALRNLPGGVETNNRGDVYQIELVGRAQDVPGYSSTWFAALALYVQRVCAETGTPIVFPCPFVPYPQSYGLTAAQRMSNDEWLACTGIVGHQHVPESDHGDPGDMSRLVDLLTNYGDDMAVAKEDLDAIAAAVWSFGVGTVKDPGAPARSILSWTKDEIDGNGNSGLEQRIASKVAPTDLSTLSSNLATVSRQVADLAGQVSALKVSGGQVDMDVLATKVADLIARRLAS